MRRTTILLLAALPIATATAQQPASPPDSTAGRQVDARVGHDGSHRARWDEKRPPKRVAVTSAHLADAFASGGAREMVLRARAARLAVDSTLRAYEAKAYQRISVGMGLRIAGRERLLVRTESAQRIRWDRDRGALIDVVGFRRAMPIIGNKLLAEDELPDVDDPIDPPHGNGQDRLWPLGSAGVEVDEREIVHPLATGSEAYYRYSIGDSLSIQLPDGRAFRLIELRVRPRDARWNTLVGSLWFDRASAQLVRAAYRLSAPMDIWAVAREDEEPDSTGKVEDPQEDIPRWLRPALNPMRMTVSGITQEFALQEQRWWLPVAQEAEGLLEVGFVRVPGRIEQRFDYLSAGGMAAAPELDGVLAHLTMDSLATDSLEKIRETLGDSAYQTARKARRAARREATEECRRSGRGTRTVTKRSKDNRILVVVPCDTARLARSPELPSSLFAPTEEMFGETERDELLKYALSFATQAGIAEGGREPPKLHYGLDGGLLRYNRVEGLSVGVGAEQVLGAGYTARATVRLATANVHPGGELALQRSDGRRAIGVGVYHRLAPATDWGDPFSLGSSLGALLFGRDEGFYYRATGVEGTRATLDGRGITWRLFAEHHGDAPIATQLSVARLLGDTRFRPNITVRRGDIAGLGARLTRTLGFDPRGWRLFADAKAEGAGGTFNYGRALLDLTLSHGIGPNLDGAITGAAGATAGAVPPQRLFHLGGAQSVRGQHPGERVGDAFWLGRAELGSSFVGARPVLFADLGWAGERSAWSHPGQPISGAGVGISFLDGLVRFDLAKGIRPSRGVRADLYLEARF